jgi:hypothetical protein
MQQDPESPLPSRSGAYRPLTFVSVSASSPAATNNTQFPPFLVNALGASQAQEYAALSRIRRTAYIDFLSHFLGKPPEFEEWVSVWNAANSEKASRMSKFHADLEAASMNFSDMQRGERDTPGAEAGKRRRVHLSLQSRIFFSKAQGHFTYELSMTSTTGVAIPEHVLQQPCPLFPTFTLSNSTTAKLLVPSSAYLQIMLEHIAGICEASQYTLTDTSTQNVMTDEHHTKLKIKFRETEQDYCIYGSTYTIRDWLTAHNAVFRPNKDDEPSFWSCRQETKTALCAFAQSLGIQIIEQFRGSE